MALTYTPAPEIGQELPQFQLPAVDGKKWSSQEIASAPAKVIVFMCNHCPYVQAIEDRLIRLAADLKKWNVPVVGICSNDASEYPADSAPELLKRWKEKNYGFTYLVDESQDVARMFGAVCTPDIYVYNAENRLCYRGRLDDSWKDATKVTREELKEAVSCVLNREPLSFDPIPSMGCSIKWRTG